MHRNAAIRASEQAHYSGRTHVMPEGFLHTRPKGHIGTAFWGWPRFQRILRGHFPWCRRVAAIPSQPREFYAPAENVVMGVTKASITVVALLVLVHMSRQRRVRIR